MIPRTRDEAIEQGLNRYYTGVPCQNGHLAPKYVIGYKCVECHRLRGIEYHADPAYKARQARYHQERKVRGPLYKYRNTPESLKRDLERRRCRDREEMARSPRLKQLYAKERRALVRERRAAAGLSP